MEGRDEPRCHHSTAASRRPPTFRLPRHSQGDEVPDRPRHDCRARRSQPPSGGRMARAYREAPPRLLPRGNAMTDEQITRVLDAVEADMRRLESRINSVRAVLRDRIDPYHRRRDLGY